MCDDKGNPQIGPGRELAHGHAAPILRLRTHHRGPGQLWSASGAIWPHVWDRTGQSSSTGLACCYRWLPAPPLLLLQQSARPLTVGCCCWLPRLTFTLSRLSRLMATISRASSGASATDISSWPCSSAPCRTCGTTPAMLPASSQIAQHDTCTCQPCEPCGLSCTLPHALAGF